MISRQIKKRKYQKFIFRQLRVWEERPHPTPPILPSNQLSTCFFSSVLCVCVCVVYTWALQPHLHTSTLKKKKDKKNKKVWIFVSSQLWSHYGSYRLSRDVISAGWKSKEKKRRGPTPIDLAGGPCVCVCVSFVLMMGGRDIFFPVKKSRKKRVQPLLLIYPLDDLSTWNKKFVQVCLMLAIGRKMKTIGIRQRISPTFFLFFFLSKIKSKINSLAKCVCVIFWPANTLCISIDYYTCIDGPYYCLIHSAWAIHQQQQQRGPFISYSPLIPKNTTQSSSRDRARDLLFRCRAPTI